MKQIKYQRVSNFTLVAGWKNGPLVAPTPVSNAGPIWSRASPHLVFTDHLFHAKNDMTKFYGGH